MGYAGEIVAEYTRRSIKRFGAGADGQRPLSRDRHRDPNANTHILATNGNGHPNTDQRPAIDSAPDDCPDQHEMVQQRGEWKG